MIDFSQVKTWHIPEGEVIKVTDAAGNVLWQKASAAVILQVAKITSDTYAAETTYEGEEFILLDIYPKSGGTVTVTYGGLAKTITDDGTAETPNAQQVYFGTFNGVSDSVETPASGELAIEGDYAAFGAGTYNKTSKALISNYCPCITAIDNWGEVTTIPDNAFYGCTGLTSVDIAGSVTSIGGSAFCGCTGLTSVDIAGSVTSIGNSAFYGCTGLTSVEIPGSVASIDDLAFSHCTSLVNIVFNEGLRSIGGRAFYMSASDEKNESENANKLPVYRSLVLPATIEEIGASAFEYYYEFEGESYDESDAYEKHYIGFESLTLLAETPPTLETDALGKTASYNNTPEIIVPSGCGDAYKAADGWSSYADIIVEAS